MLFKHFGPWIALAAAVGVVYVWQLSVPLAWFDSLTSVPFGSPLHSDYSRILGAIAAVLILEINWY
jgi:hypothetical protein